MAGMAPCADPDGPRHVGHGPWCQIGKGKVNSPVNLRFRYRGFPVACLSTTLQGIDQVKDAKLLLPARPDCTQ